MFYKSMIHINHRNTLFVRLYYSEVRVRFAPSPTGFLHLGGLRTALYNYFFAKRNHGKFILRIEDTDQMRLVEGAVEQLQQDLIWAGIHINEGPNAGGNFGPYVQSQRLDIYKKQVETVIKNKSAYYCFCTDKRLEMLRKEALRRREVPKYDNRCRYLSGREVEERLSRSEGHCIRFKLLPGYEVFEDLVYGGVSYDVCSIEGDPVIIKSDGFPTYHFANVIDDHFMEITHVLRGIEWQISTQKHIMIYRAFGWKPPIYGHLPLLLNPDGTKLSKRQGDIQIANYRDNGISPLALINFITYSGGGFAKDHLQGFKPKIYTVQELTQQFEVTNVNTHSGKLMPERLLEFNRLDLERMLKSDEGQGKLVSEVRELVRGHFSQNLTTVSLQLNEEYIKSILNWSINRINRLQDLLDKDLSFIWVTPRYEMVASNRELDTTVEIFVNSLGKVDLQAESLKSFLRNFAEDNNVAFADFMKLLRVVLSGLKEGPGVAEMIEILGKENTVSRIKAYLNKNSS